jgi:hypothetical protein
VFDFFGPNLSEFNIAVFSSVISAVLISLFNIIFALLRRYSSEQRYRAYIAWWIRLCIILFISFAICAWLFSSKLIEVISGVCFVGLVACLWKLFQLARIGIYDFDGSVRAGFNYKSALRAARNNIAFMGTGASKLTSSDEFETAIARCQMGVPNRFLLIHPDSPVLKEAAKQAGVAEDDYSNRVRASIERLARLAQGRNFKIEVKFQNANREDDLEAFRLMFVDDRFCLFSFNAYGRGDGSFLPQLVVQSKSRPEEERTFYYGMRRYFERRWIAAKPWDISEFSGGKKP